MIFDSGDTGGDDLPEIANSIRFDGTNDYLNRTPASSGNRKTFTFSGWVKRGSIGGTVCLFSAGDGTSSNHTSVRISNGGVDALDFASVEGNVLQNRKVTSALYRDTSAHMHIVVILDTTNVTASDRMQLWINGTRVTAFSTSVDPALNFNSQVNIAQSHRIATSSYTTEYLDGYLSNVCFVDGQALAPSSFAYTDPNGQWRSLSKASLTALASAGGTNSFFLPFDNGASTTTLGYDASSKGNNWTLNNMVRAAGATECWMTDTPTNNFCTLNPINYYSAGVTLGNGALSYTGDNTGGTAAASFAFDIATTQAEWQITIGSNPYAAIGVTPSESYAPSSSPLSGSNRAYYGNTGQKYIGASNSVYGATFTTGDVIKVRVDNGSVEFFKNGASQGVAWTGLTGIWYPFFGHAASVTFHVDFGQAGFTPTAGFKTLCRKNLPVPTGAAAEPSKHFTALLHTGNGSTQNVTGADFQPDLVWAKGRNVVAGHELIDSVRGTTKTLYSNLTNAEDTTSQTVTSFLSNGFSAGADTGINGSGSTYVDWLWKAGGAAVANNAGSITSQVSANTTAGFSIVTYTGTGANATVGHGLGVAPKMVIVKRRDSGVDNWWVYHSGLTSATYRLRLNTTDAQDSQSTGWNSTAPASTVFSVGSATGTNGSAQMHVAYCFAEVPGYSKISSYIGNGSADGPFVYCGFKPRWLMIKRVDSAGSWIIYDTVRMTYNTYSTYLYPNTSDAEDTGGGRNIDILSNGFKCRDTTYDPNVSGAVYAFIAFAEAPFQWSNAR